MSENEMKLIEALALKLGTTAEHLWAVLCRQAIISGICDIVAISVWAIILCSLYRYLKEKGGELDYEPKAALWALLTVCTVLTIFIVGVSLSNIAGSLINPEYWALNKIIGQIKQ